MQEAREELRGVSSQRRSDATTTQRLQAECNEWEDKARQAKSREEALAQDLSLALQAKADVEQDSKALVKRSENEARMLVDFIRLMDYMVVSHLVEHVLNAVDSFLLELLKVRKVGLFQTDIQFSLSSNVKSYFE